MSSSTPYDPYVPSSQNAAAGGPNKTAAIQAVRMGIYGTYFYLTRINTNKQIDDTVGIMRENINKVAERGERLDSLQDKTDNLAVSAQGFRRGANRVRKQMWWKDLKMRMCLLSGVIIIIVIIIVVLVVHFK